MHCEHVYCMYVIHNSNCCSCPVVGCCYIFFAVGCPFCVEAVVVTGAAGNCSAGFDINEFQVGMLRVYE